VPGSLAVPARKGAGTEGSSSPEVSGPCCASGPGASGDPRPCPAAPFPPSSFRRPRRLAPLPSSAAARGPMQMPSGPSPGSPRDTHLGFPCPSGLFRSEGGETVSGSPALPGVPQDRSAPSVPDTAGRPAASEPSCCAFGGLTRMAAAEATSTVSRTVRVRLPPGVPARGDRLPHGLCFPWDLAPPAADRVAPSRPEAVRPRHESLWVKERGDEVKRSYSGPPKPTSSPIRRPRSSPDSPVPATACRAASFHILPSQHSIPAPPAPVPRKQPGPPASLAPAKRLGIPTSPRERLDRFLQAAGRTRGSGTGHAADRPAAAGNAVPNRPP